MKTKYSIFDYKRLVLTYTTGGHNKMYVMERKSQDSKTWIATYGPIGGWQKQKEYPKSEWFTKGVEKMTKGYVPDEAGSETFSNTKPGKVVITTTPLQPLVTAVQKAPVANPKILEKIESLLERIDKLIEEIPNNDNITTEITSCLYAWSSDTSQLRDNYSDSGIISVTDLEELNLIWDALDNIEKKCVVGA